MSDSPYLFKGVPLNTLAAVNSDELRTCLSDLALLDDQGYQGDANKYGLVSVPYI